MSVVRFDGTKIVLPRDGLDVFWKLVHQHFAADDERAWRYLAMLALRENCGWPLDRIGRAFGHPKGHVTRCLRRIKSELNRRFELEDPRENPHERGSARNPKDPRC